MNNNKLIAQADELQRQADGVLITLDLLNYLSKYGHPRVVGSVALGLMTWRDIDIDLEVIGDLIEEDFWETAKHLLRQDNVTLLTLVDNRQLIEKNRPTSMYIGIKYLDADQTVWKIDLRFVSDQDAIAQKYIDSIRSKLTTETRKSILCIKNVVSSDPRYRSEFSSVDIYNAVLENGVVDIDGFKNKLRESGIEL